MGLASRGCLALVLGATAERRNLLFRSDLGLPWIRSLAYAYVGKSNRKTSWAERSTVVWPTNAIHMPLVERPAFTLAHAVTLNVVDNHDSSHPLCANG